MAPRSEAQKAQARRFMAEHAPQTQQNSEGETFVLPELVGHKLGFRRMGLVLDYQYSYVGCMDGELYHAGVITAKAPGCGVLLGLHWAWKAKEWEVIDGE